MENLAEEEVNIVNAKRRSRLSTTTFSPLEQLSDDDMKEDENDGVKKSENYEKCVTSKGSGKRKLVEDDSDKEEDDPDNSKEENVKEPNIQEIETTNINDNGQLDKDDNEKDNKKDTEDKTNEEEKNEEEPNTPIKVVKSKRGRPKKGMSDKTHKRILEKVTGIIMKKSHRKIENKHGFVPRKLPKNIDTHKTNNPPPENIDTHETNNPPPEKQNHMANSFTIPTKPPPTKKQRKKS